MPAPFTLRCQNNGRVSAALNVGERPSANASEDNVQDTVRTTQGAAIGFSSSGRLLTVVHIEVDGEYIRIISARGALQRLRKHSMINERLRKRLKKDRPTTTITMRIPVDVVESLKAIAPTRGFTAYQILLKSYISEGLRRDEAEFDHQTTRRLAEALKRRAAAARTRDCSQSSHLMPRRAKLVQLLSRLLYFALSKLLPSP